MSPVAVIAEDETALAAELTQHLARLWPELRIAAVAPDGVAALAACERLKPDILFADIEMPGLNGIALAREVAGKCLVVFVTAYDAYAVAAFDHGAVDYLLKPYEETRLALALKRIRGRLFEPPPRLDALLSELAATVRQRSYLRWVRASRGNDIDFVLIDHVCFFQAQDKYTSVMTANREAIIRMPIRELAASLDPDQFWQVSRGVLVNVAAIATVGRTISGRMTLRLRDHPERLAVSQQYRHQFRHM